MVICRFVYFKLVLSLTMPYRFSYFCINISNIKLKNLVVVNIYLVNFFVMIRHYWSRFPQRIVEFCEATYPRVTKLDNLSPFGRLLKTLGDYFVRSSQNIWRLYERFLKLDRKVILIGAR